MHRNVYIIIHIIYSLFLKNHMTIIIILCIYICIYSIPKSNHDHPSSVGEEKWVFHNWNGETVTVVRVIHH